MTQTTLTVSLFKMFQNIGWPTCRVWCFLFSLCYLLGLSFPWLLVLRCCRKLGSRNCFSKDLFGLRSSSAVGDVNVAPGRRGRGAGPMFKSVRHAICLSIHTVSLYVLYNPIDVSIARVLLIKLTQIFKQMIALKLFVLKKCHKWMLQ